jgi:hypothetical protein
MMAAAAAAAMDSTPPRRSPAYPRTRHRVTPHPSGRHTPSPRLTHPRLGGLLPGWCAFAAAAERRCLWWPWCGAGVAGPPSPLSPLQARRQLWCRPDRWLGHTVALPGAPPSTARAVGAHHGTGGRRGACPSVHQAALAWGLARLASHRRRPRHPRRWTRGWPPLLSLLSPSGWTGAQAEAGSPHP